MIRSTIVYRVRVATTSGYAWIDALGQSHGDVQVQIEGGGTPETSAPLGVTAFDGLVCVAYKGKSGNNVWMSYGKP